MSAKRKQQQQDPQNHHKDVLNAHRYNGYHGNKNKSNKSPGLLFSLQPEEVTMFFFVLEGHHVFMEVICCFAVTSLLEQDMLDIIEIKLTKMTLGMKLK